MTVTGGKGGTGKSLIATALAVELAKRHKVLLLDADVECPNDHYLLSAELKKIKDVTIPIPIINEDICIKCGKCAKVCKENALVFILGKSPIFVDDQCIGCMACQLACPVNAISRGERVIGSISEAEVHGIELVSGDLIPQEKESSPLVHALKKYAGKKKSDFVITDTQAGSHCPVIAALMDSDIALAVTEPTPLGAHDLKIILALLKELEIPGGIVLNKTGIASEKPIDDIAIAFNVPIVARVPYSDKIMEDYCNGKPMDTPEIKQLASMLEELK